MVYLNHLIALFNGLSLYTAWHMHQNCQLLLDWETSYPTTTMNHMRQSGTHTPVQCWTEPYKSRPDTLHCMIDKGNEIPVQAWTGPEGSRNWGSRISRHSAHVGLTHRPPLTPTQEVTLVLISFRGWVDPRTIVWLEGLTQWKISMTPSGMEPMTYRPVMQCIKQLHHCVPHI